jgi:catechol 2,3-dioxygenase
MSQLASTEGPAASQRGAAEGARIGHVHLRVSDLERSVQFYCRALGFHVTQYRGTRAALLSAGGYHHHVALNTRESLGGSQAPHGCTGLDHFAIVYPSHESFADAVRRVQAAGINFDRASDHGVSESIYIHDPDGLRSSYHGTARPSVGHAMKPVSLQQATAHLMSGAFCRLTPDAVYSF